MASFNPGQKRDGDGQWSDGASGAAKDALGLAKEVSTVHGPFTMAAEPGHVRTTWPASSGKPISLDLSPAEADALVDAIDRMGAAVDEYLDGGDPAAKVVGRKRVKVGDARVALSGLARPADGNGDARFESATHGWTLEIPLNEAERIQSALSDGADAAHLDDVQAAAGPMRGNRG